MDKMGKKAGNKKAADFGSYSQMLGAEAVREKQDETVNALVTRYNMTEEEARSLIQPPEHLSSK